jgi:hypothetical protein
MFALFIISEGESSGTIRHLFQHLGGRPGGEETAIKQEYAVSHAGHASQVVRDQNHRQVETPAQARDDFMEAFETCGVEALLRLVEQEQIRLGAQGKGQEHALQFAAGQLAEAAVEQMGRVHFVQRDAGRRAGGSRQAEKDRAASAGKGE